MSLSEILTKLDNARGALVGALNSQGLSLPSSASILSCADEILNISPGTDVSDTTAEAGDVLSGKVFHNSGGVLTSGTIPTVSATRSDGIVSIPQGYVPAPFTISAGAEVTLGMITSGGLFQPLFFDGLSAFKDGSAINLSCCSYNLPEPWTSSGVTISSGNSYVSRGRLWIDTTIESSHLYVGSGGTANSVTVNSEGRLHVYSGGTADSVTVNSGAHLIVSKGGTAINIVENGGFVSVNDSAAAVSFIPNEITMTEPLNHLMTVHSGTTANLDRVIGSGHVNVYQGGIVNSAKLVQGELEVSSGGIANSVTNENGFLDVFSGGTANSGIVYSGGMVAVHSGGMANDVIVLSSGRVSVRSGGTANSGIVSSAGNFNVSSGGTAFNITVSSGGTFTIYPGAVTSNITSCFGAQFMSY